MRRAFSLVLAANYDSPANRPLSAGCVLLALLFLWALELDVLAESTDPAWPQRQCSETQLDVCLWRRDWWTAGTWDIGQETGGPASLRLLWEICHGTAAVAAANGDFVNSRTHNATDSCFGGSNCGNATPKKNTSVERSPLGEINSHNSIVDALADSLGGRRTAQSATTKSPFALKPDSLDGSQGTVCSSIDRTKLELTSDQASDGSNVVLGKAVV
jgi:hypothetical protein